MLFLVPFLFSPAQATCPSDVEIQAELTCSSSYFGTVDHTADSLLGGECETDADGITSGDCYSCGEPHDYEQQIAPEAVYSFKCQQEGFVLMRITDLPCDLDIYVLDDTCDTDAGCQEGSTASYNVDDEVYFECALDKVYYIVVEAYGTSHFDYASGPCIEGETICDDGNDNDGDGLSDCEDSDCASGPECGGSNSYNGVPYSPTYTLFFDVSESTGCPEDCDDGEDNDIDGSLDCLDTDCWEEPLCCDIDGDGAFAEDCAGDDCDDSDASVYPNAPEDGGAGGAGDGKDNDCDGTTDEGTTDYDDDGDGFSESDGDCDDADGSASPAGTEVPDNGIDEDCSGADLVTDSEDECGDEEVAGNGIDDDCDGRIDEDDSEDTGLSSLNPKDGDPGEGCSCSSSPGAGSLFSLALGLPLLAWRRRQIGQG
jgi:hypothetical protein